MFYRILLSLIITIVFSLGIYAQVEIKTNVLGLSTNNYNGQVELLLNDKSGMELEASFRETSWFLTLAGSDIKNSAFRTMVSYKYYIGGEDPTAGLYFGPYLKLKVAGVENLPAVLDDNYMGTTENIPSELSVFNTALFVGLNAGQKIVFNNNIVLEYYGGIGYALYNSRSIRDEIPTDAENFISIETNPFTWPVDFRLGLSLGYRFWK